MFLMRKNADGITVMTIVERLSEGLWVCSSFVLQQCGDREINKPGVARSLVFQKGWASRGRQFGNLQGGSALYGSVRHSG